MRRSAILTAAFTLFCLSFSHVAGAQRIVPRNSIIKKPAEQSETAKTDTSEKNASIVPGTGSIMGAAVDSMHEGMLARARVTVVELPRREAVTTDNGAFRIDSIPPGRYVLQLNHPVLDSLGIRVLSDTLTVAAGQIQTIELAVPGVHTLISTVCTPAKLRFGPGVILGRVLDADTDQPAVGTEVSVAWTETEVNTTVGLRTSTRLRKATVEKDGTYRICGVPANFSGSIQAINGAAKTAEVPIVVAEQPLTVRNLSMPPSAVATTGPAGATGATTTTVVSARRVGRAVITGIVTNAGGVPVPGARVSVQGSASTTSTGPDGKFTLTGVLPGTQSVLVRRVGYSPVQMPIDVTALATNKMTVRLGAFTAVLSSVEVKAKADPLSSTGFERRRKMGMGKYIDLDDINKIRPTYTSDILRRIPGIYVNGSGSSANITTTRGNGCVNFLIDNNNVASDAGQSIDELMNSQDVAAIEFYNPVDVPMELSSGSNSGCALLVIWTKGKLDQKAPPKP
jgi:hypothetical protein